MNVLKMQRLFAVSVLIGIFLSGCAAHQPIPELSLPESSGVSIDIKLKQISLFSNKPDLIYFARIDGEGGLLQEQIRRSNYSKDGRAYLLNARPGTYVAVAAFFTAGGGPYVATHSYTTYFSKEMVEQTKVLIGANDFVFMGSYVVDQSIGLAGADAVQTHYQDVIAPGAITTGFFQLLSLDHHYRGTLLERKSDEQTRNEFFRNAKEDLAGSGWVGRLK